MSLADRQRHWQQALVQEDPKPDWLLLGVAATHSAVQRLAVYRNTMRQALIGVLAAAFPVIRQLIGVECFTATALRFVIQQPPCCPALYDYGAEFPEFLQNFTPLNAWPWLGDVARLEWLRNEALFAPEHPPLTAEHLAAVSVTGLSTLRLKLHPSARLVQSGWPIHAIWQAHQPDGGPLEQIPLGTGEAVLVWRQLGSVAQRPVTTGEWMLLQGFQAGLPLAEAVEPSVAQPDFELSLTLAVLLNDGVLINVESADDLETACGV